MTDLNEHIPEQDEKTQDERTQDERTQDERMSEVSALVFNARENNAYARQIRANLGYYGALRVINTGIKSPPELVNSWFDQLGFTVKRNFVYGGRTSKQAQIKWIPETNQRLRLMDHYPSQYYLLPNNEVQYARNTPLDVIIYCDQKAETSSGETRGGRTFVHSAKAVEEYLANEPNGIGLKLLDDLREHGFRIEVGFLNQDDPVKKDNYFPSWQEYFQTDDINQALSIASQQYDAAWSRSDNTDHSVLMTRIDLPAFVVHPVDHQSYLRFPRIAMTPPEKINGFRQYTLGNGFSLSEPEKQLLREAYLNTRQGIDWENGDFVIFDNLKYGHSKEPYSGEQRLLVGMAGNFNVKTNQIDSPPRYPLISQIYPTALPGNYSQDSDFKRYQMPPNEIQWMEEFSMRVFDAKHSLTPQRIEWILREFETYGHLLIINSGLDQNNDLNHQAFDQLGFDQDHRFKWGGQTSGRTVRQFLSDHFRSVDIYPPEMFLLPHNEILYQHYLPRKLMIYCDQPNGDGRQGGRTFIHQAKLTERLIAQTPVGQQLLRRIRNDGFTIITGFVDQNHPNKEINYFRSWQDRFGSEDRDQVLETCLAAKDQFDHCEWIEEKVNEETYWTLMTRITVPGYKSDYLMFPRIAFDNPSFKNGYRRFLIGENDLTQEETQILLNVYWDTRQAFYHQSGNILLIDNIKTGHSRESFHVDPDKPRKMCVSMADSFYTDGFGGNQLTSSQDS